MTIIDTGWLTVTNGQTTQLVVPKGKIIQARVRWRGRAGTETEHDTTVASDSGSEAANDPTGKFGLTAPDNPGWTLDEVDAHSSLSQESLDSLYCYVQAPGQSALSKTAEALSWTLAQTSADPAPNRTTYHSFNAFTPYSWDARATAHWHRHVTLYTQDPRITVTAQVTQHVGTLTQGQVSAWYAAAGFVAGVSNSVLHNITGGAGVDVQIEITYTPAAVLTLLEPAAFGSASKDALIFRVSAEVSAAATGWFPEIRASRTTDMESPEHTWCSKDIQTGWYYWDDLTETWVALPVGGAPPDAPCKLVPPALEVARWFWSGRGYDDDTLVWGDLAATRQFRLLLSVISRFALEIAGLDYSAFALAPMVSETTNGELGDMTFDLALPEGTSPPINGNAVALAVRDAAGNVEQFEAVLQGNPGRAGPRLFHCFCVLPDSVLALRYVRQDYPSQDVGITFKAIVDTYCSPLDSSGIDTATGFVRPVAGFGKTALDVGNELRELYGLLFWVRSTDSKVFLVKSEDLASPVFTVARGGPR